MSKEYSMNIDQNHVEAIRRSIELVGHISTVLEDQNGRELAGRHRSIADQGMPRQKIEVKDGLHRELIILLSNVQRQPSEEELKFRLNRVAMEYWTKYGILEEKVCASLCELLAPEQGAKVYTARRIQQLLGDRWKTKTKPQKETVSFPDALTKAESKSDELKSVKTALDILSSEFPAPTYPYPECLCKNCPRKEGCY